MQYSQAQKIVETTWERIRPSFCQNTSSIRPHTWEKSDEASLVALEEYFWGSANRFALLISKAAQYLPAGAKVLDAGAGSGILAAALKTAGFEAHASDLHQGLAIFEQESIPYQPWHLEAESAPYEDHSFDAVILSQTIEHFTYSPLKPLMEIHRIVRPGGIVIIDAPNISCFRNVTRLIRGKSLHWDLKKHYLEQIPETVHGIPYYDRHNHEYSKDDLINIAEHFGTRIEELAYYSSYNQKKYDFFTVLASHIRDSIKHWRKGIYAVYRL
jgi:SAM-dependent methyltransferase